MRSAWTGPPAPNSRAKAARQTIARFIGSVSLRRWRVAMLAGESERPAEAAYEGRVQKSLVRDFKGSKLSCSRRKEGGRKKLQNPAGSLSASAPAARGPFERTAAPARGRRGLPRRI